MVYCLVPVGYWDVYRLLTPPALLVCVYLTSCEYCVHTWLMLGTCTYM